MPVAAQAFPDAESLASDRGVDLEVWQCAGCGLVQLATDPVPYCRDVIRASAFSAEMTEFRRRQFSAFLHRFSIEGRKVIEIGCGRGEYLSVIRACGADAQGIEHAESAVKACVDKGLKVTRGFVDSPHYTVADGPFEAFFILNFLEHLPAPGVTLSGIANLLVDEGVGLVEVPNFEMIVRGDLFSEFISDHLFYFTKQTLTSTLSQNGFDVLECTEEWHDYILSAVVRKRKRLDLSQFDVVRQRITAQLHEYVQSFPEKRVAAWGAGHQALAVIALAGLGESIRYVVDSAVFKQGKYTPATHLRIVSPDSLDSDPVDAVIVMAAGYSDEVAGTLLRKYRGRVAVAILRDFGLQRA
jgi:SAM-dependent methyltransferase